MLSFVHTNLRVRDIDASVRFYEGAGMQTEALPIYEYETFAEDLNQGAHGP